MKEEPEIEPEWAEMARRAREKWARENPYIDRTGNNSQTYSITES